MSSHLVSSAFLFPKGAPTTHTDPAWFRRPVEESESSLDALEREEAAYVARLVAIRKVAAPKPIGTCTNEDVGDGMDPRRYRNSDQDNSLNDAMVMEDSAISTADSSNRPSRDTHNTSVASSTGASGRSSARQNDRRRPYHEDSVEFDDETEDDIIDDDVEDDMEFDESFEQ